MDEILYKGKNRYDTKKSNYFSNKQIGILKMKIKSK